MGKIHNCRCGKKVKRIETVEYRTKGGQVRRICKYCDRAGLANKNWTRVGPTER